VLNRWKTKQHATQQNKTKENTKLFPDFVGSLFKPLFITLLFLYSPHLKRTRGKPEPPVPGAKTKGRTKRNQNTLIQSETKYSHQATPTKQQQQQQN